MYACQLITDNTNESLIKAYAWLNVAAQEVDAERRSKILMHKIGFELKKRELFNEALIVSKHYYECYSPDAICSKTHDSKNPFNYFLKISFYFMMLIINQVEFFDQRIIKKRESSFVWGLIALISFGLGILATILWAKNAGYLNSIFLVSSLFCCMLSVFLYEARIES